MRSARETVRLHFSGLVTGFLGIPALAVLACLLWFFWLSNPEIRIPVGAFAGFIGGYLLLMVVASFDRRPLLVLEPDGVRLPCAGDILLGYDEIEVWAEERRENHSTYWSFSLQRSPRLHLDISWWAWLRWVRVNRLLDGDLLLDERFLDIGARRLVQAIEARQAAAG